jgi:hypothetical protein
MDLISENIQAWSYNTAWLNGLLYKLISRHLPDYLLSFLKFYLEGRTFKSTWMTLPPPQKLTPSSLPLGAVLPITLFSLYLSDMPHPPYTHLTVYADNTVLLSQSWCAYTISCRLSHNVQTLLKYFHHMEIPIIYPQKWNNLFSKCPFPDTVQIHHTWAVHYLGFVLDPKLL